MSLGKSFQKLFRRKSRDLDGREDVNGNASEQLILREGKPVSTTSRFTKHSVTPSDLNEPVVQKVFAESESFKTTKNFPPRVVTEVKVRFGDDTVKGSNRSRVTPKKDDVLNNNKKNRNNSAVNHSSVGSMSNKIFMVRFEMLSPFFAIICDRTFTFANKNY